MLCGACRYPVRHGLPTFFFFFLRLNSIGPEIDFVQIRWPWLLIIRDNNPLFLVNVTGKPLRGYGSGTLGLGLGGGAVCFSQHMSVVALCSWGGGGHSNKVEEMITSCSVWGQKFRVNIGKHFVTYLGTQ